MHARVVLYVAVAATAACSDSTAPAALPLRFEAREVFTEPAPVSVTSGVASVAVTGGFQDGSCGPAGARGVRDGTVLRLTVGTTPTGRPCLALMVTYDYSAVLVDLPPGVYTVEVYHAPAGAAPLLARRTVIEVE